MGPFLFFLSMVVCIILVVSIIIYFSDFQRKVIKGWAKHRNYIPTELQRKELLQLYNNNVKSINLAAPNGENLKCTFNEFNVEVHSSGETVVMTYAQFEQMYLHLSKSNAYGRKERIALLEEEQQLFEKFKKELEEKK